MLKELGGDAFPRTCCGEECETGGHSEGMSLRDWFAGMALQGLSGTKLGGDVGAERFAELTAEASFLLADEMLKARKK